MRPAIKAGLKQSVEAANAYMRQLLECRSILSGHEESKKKYFETLSQIATQEYRDLILAQVWLARAKDSSSLGAAYASMCRASLGMIGCSQ
jgi:hypothetical protein